jgi:hypothetical protein
MRDEALHEELARLRARLGEAEECSYGLLQALMHVLPALLKDHPRAEQVHRLLQAADDRYGLLLSDPLRADRPGETYHRYEPLMQLNRMLGTLGVWPGADPATVARTAIARPALE